MKDRMEQNKNFVTAIKSDVGGRLQLWKQAYPIVIEHIQNMILGYNPKKFKEEYQSQFKQFNNLMYYFNKLQTSIDFDFMWPYMKAMNQNGELEKLPAMRFQQLMQDFSIITHQYSLKWARIYQKYFHRLFKKHPQVLKLIRERFDLPEGMSKFL